MPRDSLVVLTMLFKVLKQLGGCITSCSRRNYRKMGSGIGEGGGGKIVFSHGFSHNRGVMILLSIEKNI